MVHTCVENKKTTTEFTKRFSICTPCRAGPSVAKLIGSSKRHERKYNTSTGCLDITPVPDAILSPAPQFAHAAFSSFFFYHAALCKLKVARMPLELKKRFLSFFFLLILDVIRTPFTFTNICVSKFQGFVGENLQLPRRASA